MNHKAFPNYRNALVSPELLGLHDSFTAPQFQALLQNIAAQAANESAASLWWLYLAVHQRYVGTHIPLGSAAALNERLPGLQLERLPEQQFPDVWQYLVSIAEKSLGLPSEKSLVASKCLQYGASRISRAYFQEFVGSIGLEAQHWQVNTLPVWVFESMRQAGPGPWSRYLRVCRSAGSSGVRSCSPLDAFFSPNTAWARELVLNNPLPPADDHRMAQWLDELRFQVWLPQVTRRKCEDHFVQSHPHLAGPAQLAFQLDVPLTECMNSLEPHALPIDELDNTWVPLS